MEEAQLPLYWLRSSSTLAGTPTTPHPIKEAGLQRPPIYGTPYLRPNGLTYRATKFDVITHVQGSSMFLYGQRPPNSGTSTCARTVRETTTKFRMVIKLEMGKVSAG